MNGVDGRPFDVTIISAVYNVARYLPEFIASLEAQRSVDLARIEVIAVDDGSTDDSRAVLEQWAAQSQMAVRVLGKANGGQGSARNFGLEHAQGTWVTFTDPDDTLEPHYLARVLAFATAHPESELLATARWMHFESTDRVTNSHPLRYMFKTNALVDLNEAPTFFHGSAPAAFFRLDRLLESGVRFDDRIRPNFEDGYFCSRYLLAVDRPLVGFVASAHYIYRKRADGSSTLNSSVAQPERYTVVPRLGYLDLLQRAQAASGRPPGWLQNFVLYELSWYFSAEASMSGNQTAATGVVAGELVAALREIVKLLDATAVEEFSIRVFESAWRDILLHGVFAETWHAPYAVRGPSDAHQGLVRVIHRFTGAEPVIEYSSGGQPLTPVHTKIRSHIYFDNDLLQERLSWVPDREDLVVRVNGEEVPLVKLWPRPSNRAPQPLSPIALRLRRWWRRLRDPRRAVLSVSRRVIRKLCTTGPIARRYRDAWVLMDRIHDADDSGEHLFAYLRTSRPDINAWFVLEAGTPDWERLKPQLGPRLVAHGSWTWTALMLNCIHMISSHVDKPVHRPDRIVALLKPRAPQWRFSFLQHGIIKDDLSRWLNPKGLHLFVTSTAAEYQSVAGDGTQYVYTSREAQLTGLPRFDRLLQAAERVPAAERRLLLVAPTWRHWLVPPLAAGSQRRTVREDFLDTEYAQEWLGLVTSERLAQLSAEHDLQIGFLPHPNLQSILPLLDLPAHVRPLSFVGSNIQDMFARTALLVTDYSSMAFNVAYLDRPVVYFQFDKVAMETGAHIGRAGYFRYDRDGLGPVVETVPAALHALEEIVTRGCTLDEVFAQRVKDTFVLRDGKCCERVTAAIEAIRAPHTSPHGADAKASSR